MLYNEVTKYLDEALHVMGTGKEKKDPSSIEKFGKAVVKAQEIITELMVSLDFEQGGDIAKNLFSLYTWFNRELIEANISQDARRVSKVRDFIDDLRGAWLAVISTGTAAEPAKREVVGISIAG